MQFLPESVTSYFFGKPESETKAPEEPPPGITFTSGYANTWESSRESADTLQEKIGYPVASNFDRKGGVLDDTRTFVMNKLGLATPESEHVREKALAALERGGKEIFVGHSKGTTTTDRGMGDARNDVADQLVSAKLETERSKRDGEDATVLAMTSADGLGLEGMYQDLGRHASARRQAEEEATERLAAHVVRINAGSSSKADPGIPTEVFYNPPDPVATFLGDRKDNGRVTYHETDRERQQRANEASGREGDALGHNFNSCYSEDVAEAVKRHLPEKESAEPEERSSGGFWSSWFGGASDTASEADRDESSSSRSFSDEQVESKSEAPAPVAPAEAKEETSEVERSYDNLFDNMY